MRAERKKALIVVRTYPTPSRKGIEVSCTAAITEFGEWLRLYPVPYRLLEDDQRFRKYQWVGADCERSTKDSRPESYRLAQDGITILDGPLSKANGWSEIRKVVDPMRSHCLCCVQEKRDRDGAPTLALIKPHAIQALVIEEEEQQNWSNFSSRPYVRVICFSRVQLLNLKRFLTAFFTSSAAMSRAVVGIG